MAENQGTPLSRKLGIKPGHRVAVVDAPETFDAALGTLPPGVELVYAAAADDALGAAPCDVIVWFATRRDALGDAVARFGSLLTPAGGLWIGWPKRASGIATEVDADVVREVALPTGLVDNKICAIDSDWSGIRLVLRRELRSS
ncbi:DUF3052 family protein [Actinospica robiniae]|uniref:DUF3052 family protein n=1 Tax=Actinospica robiniae TaxID=304901 RepID=UPI0004185A7E|nr:DUF3052 family protein [Actinospica robiniae]